MSADVRAVVSALLLGVASCKYRPSARASRVTGVLLALADVWSYGNPTLFLDYMKPLNARIRIVFISKALSPKAFYSL